MSDGQGGRAAGPPPACERCGTALDPDGSCFSCDAAGVTAVGCESCGLPSHMCECEPAGDGGGDGQEEEARRRDSQATRLVRLARERYRLLSGDDGKPYAAEAGASVAHPLRGRSGLRQQIARAYAAECGSVPSATALADALCVLEADCASGEPEPVWLRVAPCGSGVVVDLGTPDGRCVIAEPGGWRVEPRSPVLFRRTQLTGVLPDPVPGGSLDALAKLVNADEDSFRLLAGFAVHALLPGIPHAILLLLGEQGTAKSTCARLLAGLTDPGPAPLRSPPRDIGQWAVAASASWLVCLDNVSRIPAWLSDSLCKASTGDGLVTRSLYTDDDVSVLSFRRVCMLTSIDAGSLRGDLGDRLLPVELEVIADSKRRTEAAVLDGYETARPALLGALLDLLCGVLEYLPGIELDGMPRMADFARVLAAVDKVKGWETFATYAAAAGEVAQAVIESDQFAQEVAALARGAGSWAGTASELLEKITPEYRPQWWPATARAASGRLRRAAPSLRQAGVKVEFGRAPGTGGARLITVSLESPDRSCESSDFASQPSDLRHRGDGRGDGATQSDGLTDNRTSYLGSAP